MIFRSQGKEAGIGLGGGGGVGSGLGAQQEEQGDGWMDYWMIIQWDG